MPEQGRWLLGALALLALLWLVLGRVGSKARHEQGLEVGESAPIPDASAELIPTEMSVAEIAPLPLGSGRRIPATLPAPVGSGGIRVQLRVLGLAASERALVEVSETESTSPPSVHETDEAGMLVLSLAPGRFGVSAKTKSRSSTVLWTVIQPTDEERALSLELSCGLVEGWVFGGPGRRPIEGARVWISAHRENPTRTDGTGRYLLTGLRDDVVNGIECAAEGYAPDGVVLRLGGNGRWSVERAGHPPVSSTEAAGIARLDFELLPERTLTGRIVDPDGKPLLGATVSVEGNFRLGHNASIPNCSARSTRPDGTFEVPSLRPDITHHVRVSMGGFSTETVAVPPSLHPVRDLGTIALERRR